MSPNKEVGKVNALLPEDVGGYVVVWGMGFAANCTTERTAKSS